MATNAQPQIIQGGIEKTEQVKAALNNKDFLQASPDVQTSVLSKLSSSYSELSPEAQISVLSQARQKLGIEQPQEQPEQSQPAAPQDLGFFQTALNKGIENATLGIVDTPESSNVAGNLVGGFAGGILPVGLGTLVGGLPGGVAAAGALGAGTDIREQLNQGRQAINFGQSALSGLGGAAGQFLGGKFGTTLLKDALINAGVNVGRDASIQGFNNNGQVDLGQLLSSGLQGVAGSVAGRALPQLGNLGKITNDVLGAIGLRGNSAKPVGLAGLERLAQQQQAMAQQQALPAQPSPQQPTGSQEQQLDEQGAAPVPKNALDRVLSIQNPTARLGALKEREARLLRGMRRAKTPEAQALKEAELQAIQKGMMDAKAQEADYKKNLQAQRSQQVLQAQIQAYGAPITAPNRMLPSPQAVKQQRVKEAVQQATQQRINNAKQRAQGRELPSSGEVITPAGKPKPEPRKLSYEEQVNKMRQDAVGLENPKLVQKDLGKIEAQLEKNIRENIERPTSLKLLAEVQKQREALKKQGKADYLSSPRPEKALQATKAKPQTNKLKTSPPKPETQEQPTRPAPKPVQKTQQLEVGSYKSKGEVRYSVKQKQADGTIKTIATKMDEATAKAYVKKTETFAKIQQAAEAIKSEELNKTQATKAQKAEVLREFVPKEAMKYFNTAAKAMEQGHMVDEVYVAEKVGVREGSEPFSKGLTTPVDFGINAKTGDVNLSVIDEKGQLVTRIIKEGGQGFIERSSGLKKIDANDIISEYAGMVNTKTLSPFKLERVRLTPDEIAAKGANYNGDGFKTVVLDEGGNVVPQKGQQAMVPVSQMVKNLVAAIENPGGLLTTRKEFERMSASDTLAVMMDAPPRVRKYLKKALTDKDCC